MPRYPALLRFALALSLPSLGNALFGVTFLQPDEQVLLKGLSTLEVRNGPGLKLTNPFVTSVTKRKGTTLDERQYIVVKNTLTGVRRVEKGPGLFFAGPYDEFDRVHTAFELQNHQYIKLLDSSTGVIRVERGEQMVFPTAYEEPLRIDGLAVRNAIDVDEDTAVLVRSKQSGQQRLVVEQALFVPGALEEIVEVRKLIRVEPYEVAIVRDNSGALQFYDGSAGEGKGTAFFLPPYCELVTQYWSSATSPEDLNKKIINNQRDPKYKIPMEKIPLRQELAFFEYNVNTQNHVPLLLQGTITWQVTDVQKMVAQTQDPKGDVWHKTRAALIQAVSRVTLDEFQLQFNEIAKVAASTEAEFYESIGVTVHALELTNHDVVDQKTARIIQEIVQETTNRKKSLEKQRSETEVEQERMTSQIEIEKQRKALVEARTANDKLQASVEGEAEGTRLAQSAKAFLAVLDDAIPKDSGATTRLDLLRFFSEQRTLTQQTEHLAQGTATLFLTPQDVNLKLQVPSSARNLTGEGQREVPGGGATE